MSIEAKIETLTQAILALTAAMSGNKAAVTGGGKTGGGKKTGGTKAATKSEMNAAVNEVKEQKGVAAAKKLLKGAGFEKLADVTADLYQEVYDAAKEVLEGECDPAGDDDL